MTFAPSRAMRTRCIGTTGLPGRWGGRLPGHVTFGMLTASLLSRLAGVYLPGKYSLIHSVDLKFQKPVFAGDTLTVAGTVADRQEELKLLLIKARITNQEGKCVCKADMKVLVMR